jgi:hypothetical protein
VRTRHGFIEFSSAWPYRRRRTNARGPLDDPPPKTTDAAYERLKAAAEIKIAAILGPTRAASEGFGGGEALHGFDPKEAA